MKHFFGMVTTRPSTAYTMPALASFFRNTALQPDDRFFLIDNDGAFATEKLSAFREVTVLRNPAPLGFAENVNQILRQACTAKASLVFLNNDIIFTKGWFEPLRSESQVLISPLSNREVQYAASVHVIKTKHIANLFACSMEMKLEQYLGNEAALEAIAEGHRRIAQGRISLYVVPFFAIKIPYAVIESVGCFDTSFGKAGGEDYDYSLRAWLAGFQVQFALDSWILHFYGKSSWSGVESGEQRNAREAGFMQAFKQKWGSDLFELLLHEDVSILEKLNPASRQVPRPSIPETVRQLLQGRQIQIRLW